MIIEDTDHTEEQKQCPLSEAEENGIAEDLMRAVPATQKRLKCLKLRYSVN
jgi:hypothetical protein